MPVDHYDVLGVPPDAGHTQIRAAYRRLMRHHHPDLRPGDPRAEQVARRLTAAWAVLGQPSSRAAYDRARSGSRMAVVAAPHARPAASPAYSPESTAYRRAFYLASLRMGALVVALGITVLAALTL